MNIFTNCSTWVDGSLFRVLENLGKFIGMAIGIKLGGMLISNPFDNIMGSIIGLRNGGGFTIGGNKLITSGGLIIGGGGGLAD
jgi:hypothetical protein